MTNRTHDSDVRGITADEILGRIVLDATLEAGELKDTQNAIRNDLLTLLAWTEPADGVDADDVLEAFSSLAKLVVRVGHHAIEREQLVRSATEVALLARENATTERN